MAQPTPEKPADIHETTRPYEITLPGITDIIAIRPLESPALYYERIKRMREQNSPLPDFLKWAPKLIGQLDDAQDLLYTGLVLAKPLLRRAPAYIVPAAGWLLLANDILNLGTWLVGTVLTGPSGKAKLARTIDAWTGGAYRNFNQLLSGRITPQQVAGKFGHTINTKLAAFTRANHTFGFLIQAPQALYTVTSWAGKKAQELGIIDKQPMHFQTGIGLQLGAVMGMVSDTVWSAIRAPFRGAPTIVLPPSNDPVMKAARYVINSADANAVHDWLSPADHSILIAAHSIAAQILADAVTTDTFIDRFDTAMRAPTPQCPLWNPTSIAALRAWGIDTTLPLAELQPGPTPERSFGELVTAAAARQPAWEEAMARVYGKTTHASAMQMLTEQAGADYIGTSLNGGDPGRLTLSPQEAISLRMTEWNLYPGPWPTAQRARQLLDRGDLTQYAAEFNTDGRYYAMVNDLSATLLAQDRITPTRDQLQDAITRHWGYAQAR